MTLAQDERNELCDLLLKVGPAAPTLCEGWDTHDLACHLWVRENQPLSAAGIVLPALAEVTARRMADVRERWSYRSLVGRIAGGPPRVSIFGLPGMDAQANGVEFFVHHEDVRRAGSSPLPPRQLRAEHEDLLWRRASGMGRLAFRKLGVGVVLERTDIPAGSDGREVRLSPGARTVTVRGRPGELMLYAFGRARAVVSLIGEPDAVTELPHSQV